MDTADRDLLNRMIVAAKQGAMIVETIVEMMGMAEPDRALCTKVFQVFADELNVLAFAVLRRIHGDAVVIPPLRPQLDVLEVKQVSGAAVLAVIGEASTDLKNHAETLLRTKPRRRTLPDQLMTTVAPIAVMSGFLAVWLGHTEPSRNENTDD